MDRTALEMRRAAAREYYATCTAYADGLEHKSDPNYSYAVALVSRYVAAPMALLEIGCGTGRLAEIIATTTGCSITATDVSPHFLGSLGCSFLEVHGARTRWLGPLAGSIHLAMRRTPTPALPTGKP